MRDNVIPLQTRRRHLRRSPTCPAQFYKFAAEPAHAFFSEPFLEKAAAFQEIRDCLTAADHNEITAREAERRIQFFVRAYLSLD